MPKATKKQEIARSRNWNKRVLKCAAYSLMCMANVKRLRIGLTLKEAEDIYEISNQLFTVVSKWKRTIN